MFFKRWWIFSTYSRKTIATDQDKSILFPWTSLYVMWSSYILFKVENWLNANYFDNTQTIMWTFSFKPMNLCLQFFKVIYIDTAIFFLLKHFLKIIQKHFYIMRCLNGLFCFLVFILLECWCDYRLSISFIIINPESLTINKC